MSTSIDFRSKHVPASEVPASEVPAAETPDGDGNQSLPNVTAVQIQQEYYENLLEYDWVKYEKSNRNHLIQNIAFALFGSPSLEGELLEFEKNVSQTRACAPGDVNPDEVRLQGYTSRQKERVMKIFEKLCEQGKYSLNDEDILMSVLLVVCCKPQPLKFYKLEPPDYWWDLHVKSDSVIWCTAVFRVRKCIPSFDGAQSCRLYIDEDARVYHGWESFLENNMLPKCVLVVPENGWYTGELNEAQTTLAVKLSVVPSPALGPKARIISVADTTSTVASLGAIGVMGAAMFTPVGPVVLAGATVATVATGLYGLVRSSLHLHDRSTHEQTISPTDSEARGSWFNIAASSVGIAAGAATSLLSKSAAAGTNMTKTGLILETSVDVLRHANLLTGGVGLANSLANFVLRYRKHGETPSKLELFQFTASTLFFANAVMSNRTAQSIIEEAQTKTINEYRDTLRSNRHRKMFDKVSAETRRIGGVRTGNAEVIQGIKNIANKDQYFADVLKLNKEVNANRLRISMTSDGRVNLNAQHKFNPSDLIGMGRDGRTEIFTKIGPAELTASNVPTRLYSPSAVGKYTAEEETENKSSFVNIRPGEILRIGTLALQVSSSGAEGIADLLQDLSADLHGALMTVSLNVLAVMVPAEIAKLRLLHPDKDLIVQTVEFVFNFMKHNRPFGEACARSDNGIVVILKEFFQDGHIKRNTLLFLKDRYLDSIDEGLRERRVQYPNKKAVTCDACNGIRYA